MTTRRGFLARIGILCGVAATASLVPLSKVMAAVPFKSRGLTTTLHVVTPVGDTVKLRFVDGLLVEEPRP